MTETWIQLMEQILARTPGVVNRSGDHFVPGCSYCPLDLDENCEPTPELIAAERLTESTYHEITTQLEAVWGHPEFQGDGAGSGLRAWHDAARLAYWQRRDDLAIVAIQAYDDTRHYSLTLSVRSATKLAPRARAYREKIAREAERWERAFQELVVQPLDPRWAQVVINFGLPENQAVTEH
jgi:hypothetical protein